MVDGFLLGVLGVGIVEGKISYKLEYFGSSPNSELLLLVGDIWSENRRFFFMFPT